MARRVRRSGIDEALQPYPYTKTFEYENLTPELEFQVVGESCWFHFHALVVNDAGLQWVDAFGGNSNSAQQFRSFRLERIKRDARGRIKTRKWVPVKQKQAEENK